MPKLLFISEFCLLDHSSDAAKSVRAMLKALADAGWEAQSATLTCCDGDREYTLSTTYPSLDPDLNAGARITVQDDILEHEIFVARSTLLRKLRPWEVRAYLEMAEVMMEAFKPDIVLTYGSELLHPLLARAQRLGAQTVYFMASPAVLRRPNATLPYVDEVIVPSQFVSNICKETLDKSAHLIRPIVTRFLDGHANQSATRLSTRAERFVTLIDPSPQKGGLFFINIAAQLAIIAPQVKCRAVESGWTRGDWEKIGVSIADLDRIDWYPDTQDMASVYNDSAVLLVPSLREESAVHVIAEALIAGVPVLAMKNGGMPEDLGEGGILFDLSPELVVNPLASPEAKDLLRWAQFIQVLMENDNIYGRAVALALEQADHVSPERRSFEAVKLFSELLDAPAKAATEGDPALITALQQHRDRMRLEREEINARIESGIGADSVRAEDTPYLPLFQSSLAQPAIKEALEAAGAKDWEKARHILESYLRLVSEDLPALALLAEVAVGQQREAEALQLLQRLVELAPGFLQGQQRLLSHLRYSGNASAALKHSAVLMARAPKNPRYQVLHAGLLTAANCFDEAIAVYDNCFESYSGSAYDWMQYGLALKTLGRQSEGIAAYRKAIEITPKHAAAWHGLSNMKLTVFEQADIDYMEQLLDEEGLSDEDRSNLHFTLGKAHEDAKSYEASFEHYAKANAFRRSHNDYDVSRVEDYVAKVKQLFTTDFLDERKDFGHKAADPIFVLGMHRAGSTLTEQILASHSQIEGTRELPNMLQIGRYFGGLSASGQERSFVTDLVCDLSLEEAADLGRMYLDLSRPERFTERPYFIDKMPANWMYTGLIHLMLPNAKIIDIRRKPMAAGFALFKMNFGRGVDHSYDQEDIARYYCAYADLMAHFDDVLPGRVHHIQYETLVENTEAEINRLIDYCDLPLEEGCLHYWETERAIQTPSSEQVRQPIFKGAVEQWRNYADWLGPMRAAFGDLLAHDTAELNHSGLAKARA